MMRLIRTAWKHSWWVTLPVTVFFLLWASRTAHRYGEYHVRQEIIRSLDLRQAGELQLAHMIDSAKVEAAALGQTERLASTGLRTISLFLNEGRLQQLDSHLPHSGHHYMDGAMSEGSGPVQNVELRYRGDSVYHWGYWKKSWRVKTKKGELFHGMRKFNLVAPRSAEIMNNHLSYRLAAHMGLISPHTEMVNVILNGDLLGAYILTEQLDESTIRRHDLMPGDVYSGDIAGQQRYVGASVQVFEHLGAWTKPAVNNHFALDAMDPLAKLLFLTVRPGNPRCQAQLSEFLDMEAAGRAAAFEILVQTLHSDESHNWRFYYDPWKTQMVPIVWDPMGWFAVTKQQLKAPFRPDTLTSQFHRTLFRNGDYLRARDTAMQRFFDEGRDQSFLEEARQIAGQLEGAILSDPHHAYHGRKLSRSEVLTETLELPNRIEATFLKAKRAYLEDPRASLRFARLAANRIQLEVAGRSPVSEIELQFSHAPRSPVNLRIEFDTAHGPTEVDVSGATTLTGSTLRLHTKLLPRFIAQRVDSAQGGTARTMPATYDLNILSGLGKARLLHVRARRTESGPLVRVEQVDSIRSRSLGSTARAVEETPLRQRRVMRGEVLIQGNEVVEQDLVIRAGTRLRFGPGANLLVKGHLTAVGQENAPIEFIPAEEGQEPWGVLALKGAGANGSQLEHCHFQGGSGWVEPLAEYSAMFSIHHVQQVTVESCVFEDSRVVDDMVHGVYSDVLFEGCTFRRSRSDALDMDISTVRINACVFEESGNDSVDLMTTRATVTNSRFLHSGDKGVSVGEDSTLLVSNSIFDDCLIAIQSKDDSTATLFNCSLLNCPTGVDAYKKNWRYDGGGEAFVYKSSVSATETPFQADKHSAVTVRDTYVEGLAGLKTKRIDLDDSVDDIDPSVAKSKKFTRLPADVEALGNLGMNLPKVIKRTRRGTTLPAQ